MLARLWLALERTRLRLHFARVRLLLRAAPAPAGVCPAARARSLAQLEAYAREGRFPLHGGRGRRRPVFVDHAGTHCAVGHLLAVNGHADLVRGIRAERNHAFVPDLAPVPGVLPALSSLGLTGREAARIQPTYASGPSVNLALENGGGAISTLLLTAMIAVGVVAVVLACGLFVSARVRHLFWTGGHGRRVVTALILVLGGIVAMRAVMGLGYV